MAEVLRGGFRFRAGHPALDLPATLAARRKPLPRELLASPGDLDRWLVAAGVVASAPGATPADLEAARALREACYRLAGSAIRGEAYDPASTALLNAVAAQAPPRPQLTSGGLRWEHAGVASLLAAIARAGVELLGGPNARRIRACSGPGCALLFLDLSRAGDRRWCSMSTCGNRAKVAAFRKRQGHS